VLLLLAAGWAAVSHADDSVALELPVPRAGPAEPQEAESRAIEVPAQQEPGPAGRAGSLPPEFFSPLPPLPPPVPAEQPPSPGPDSFSALEASYDEFGVVQASSVTFRIVSLLTEGALVCTADSGSYDPKSGEATLSGTVHVELEGTALALDCSELYFDPLLGHFSISGLEIAIPFEELVPRERLPEDEIQARLGSHFYSATPSSVFIKADSVRIDQGPSRSEFVMRGVQVTHSPRPDPDLFVTAAELRLDASDRIILQDIALVVSGTEVFAWPRLSRNLKKERRVISLGVPEVHFDRQVGLAWRQPLQMDFQSLQVEGIFDYSPDYGLRLKGSAYIEPAPLGRLAFEAGESSSVDVRLRNVKRRDKYNFVYQQEIKSPMAGIQRITLDTEYGEVSSFTDPLPGQGLGGISASDTRLAAIANVRFDAIPLGGNLYLTSGGDARLYDYQDSNTNYKVLGANAGLVFHQPGFDHFVLYSLNKTSGEPVFSFDEVREEEVDFATSLRLHPEWRHVVRGIYDVQKGEFNQLQVGAMKKQRSYELGMYWDFARESAGFEFGLRMD
jgi:hypothetical protein